ncbi:MAG: hypothetical protein WBW74_10545 [Xanthobacteraceae bacterium]
MARFAALSSDAARLPMRRKKLERVGGAGHVCQIKGRMGHVACRAAGLLISTEATERRALVILHAAY